MKKENMRIKENITISDQINVINYIMDYYFTDGNILHIMQGLGKLKQSHYSLLMVLSLTVMNMYMNA